jgi:hypothetical protein
MVSMHNFSNSYIKTYGQTSQESEQNTASLFIDRREAKEKNRGKGQAEAILDLIDGLEQNS